jgi:hypothetical protein
VSDKCGVSGVCVRERLRGCVWGECDRECMWCGRCVVYVCVMCVRCKAAEVCDVHEMCEVFMSGCGA